MDILYPLLLLTALVDSCFCLSCGGTKCSNQDTCMLYSYKNDGRELSTKQCGIKAGCEIMRDTLCKDMMTSMKAKEGGNFAGCLIDCNGSPDPELTAKNFCGGERCSYFEDTCFEAKYTITGIHQTRLQCTIKETCQSRDVCEDLSAQTEMKNCKITTCDAGFDNSDRRRQFIGITVPRPITRRRPKTTSAASTAANPDLFRPTTKLIQSTLNPRSQAEALNGSNHLNYYSANILVWVCIICTVTFNLFLLI